MQESCDVAVIGGAFSGAATSLQLRREAPGLRVVVIERSKHFDRKVGEATTEVSGCFLTRRLESRRGECCDLEDLNARFSRSFRSWFEALYKDKYHYLGDKELMTAAFLMDLGLFFLGPVFCPRAGFAEFPFEGSIEGAIVSRLMGFYNRRLARIAQKRLITGVYGSKNLHSRTLLRDFEPNRQVWKLIFRGLRIWLQAELRSFFLPAPGSAPVGCPASAT
jgi:hypothetical protein